MHGLAESPMQSLERCLQGKVRPKERPTGRCTCRLPGSESCCLLQANRLGDISRNVKICIHSSDNIVRIPVYSLIVIHQIRASTEGVGALFVLGGHPPPSLGVFIGLKPRSNTLRKTKKPTFESPLETKEDLSG